MVHLARSGCVAAIRALVEGGVAVVIVREALDFLSASNALCEWIMGALYLTYSYFGAV